jgi:hypothetical protein
MFRNLKSEARNSVSCRTLDVRQKQIRMTNVSNPKQKNLFFEHLNFGFRDCLEFRISILGF